MSEWVWLTDLPAELTAVIIHLPCADWLAAHFVLSTDQHHTVLLSTMFGITAYQMGVVGAVLMFSKASRYTTFPMSCGRAKASGMQIGVSKGCLGCKTPSLRQILHL